jgi:PHP family Zn ribbon phosphoesterase
MKPMELYGELDTIIGKIRDVNDEVLEVSDNLHLILLNLLIEGAHLKEANAVGVIAGELEKIVKKMKTDVDALIHENREELRSVMEEVRDYLKEYEAIKKEGC